MFSLKKWLVIPSAFVLFTSCDPLENVGPTLCPSEDFSFEKSDLKIDVVSKNGGTFDFTALSDASNKVDLAEEGLYVHASLSESVKWELEIKMENGGSSKIYKGEGDEVSVYWYGNSSKAPLFSAGKAKLNFQILCAEEVNEEITLENTPLFKNVHPGYGSLIRDWDQNGDVSINSIGTPNWLWGIGDGFLWADTVANQYEVRYNNTDPSPMGGYYIDLYAKKPAPTYYHYATGMNSSLLGDIVESLPTSNADSLYLNFYARGNQDYANTSLEIVYQGDEKGIWTEHLNWEGWKLISIPLSDFKVGTASMQSGADLSYIAIQLGCQPAKYDEAQYDLDFMILTVGSPFFDE